MSIAELPTPAGIVDLDVLERNAEAMSARARRLGVRLRPHVKTHGTVEAARVQVRGHFGGVTVSRWSEARAMADGGFRDITHAVPVAPSRLREVAELGARIDRMSVLLDSHEAAAELERCASATGAPLAAFLEVDCGHHRTGVDPTRPESRALAARLASSSHVEFRGLLTHAGQSYACRTREDRLRVAVEERDAVVGFARRLRDDGLAVPEVSVGSTPTMTVAEDLTGVTEIRPGNYAFFDLFQSALGSCADTDIAFSVLTTVISVLPEERRFVVDAGALALSLDPGPCHVVTRPGHGRVRSEDGSRDFPGLRVEKLSQEHGVVRVGERADVPALRVGTRLRILPNHSCLAAACFTHHHAVRGAEVVATWQRVQGW